MYVRVWLYHVPTSSVPAFIAAYGSDGDWARLFRRGPGYLGTRLLRDTEAEETFLTVDRWTDEAAWLGFSAAWRAEYKALDAALDDLAVVEHALIEGST